MIDHDDIDAMRERARKEEDARRARIGVILRDNPSLSRAQAEVWDQRQRESLPRLPPKCCPCQRRGRVEIVAAGDVIGPCKCDCHGGAS